MKQRKWIGRIGRLLVAGLVLLALSACGEGAVTTETETPAPTAAPTATPEPLCVLKVQEPTDFGTLSTTLMETETIEAVEIDPGMMCNADLARLIGAFPHLTVRCAVQLGGAYCSPDEVTELSTETVSVAEIAEALPCLPNLRTVRLGACTPELLTGIREQLPGVELRYAVTLYGREVDRDTELLDLSDLEELSAAELAAALPFLPALKTVSLGVREDREAVEAFRSAVPSIECVCVCRFTYLGRTLTDGDETLDLSNTAIPDLGELRQVIERMPHLTRVEMLNCGLDDATMGGLCDAYPQIKFVWEINLGYWGKLRTDATAYSTRSRKTEIQVKNKLRDNTVQYIRYCTDLVALDLGHQSLTDISFLAPLKKLRVVILSDNYISDVSVLGELPELEYIELFMNRVEDVSALAKLTKLRDLNLCSNKVTDFTPLLSIKTLQRLWYARNNYTDEDHERLKEALPDCLLNHTVADGTGDGWRKHENYYWMHAFFEGAPRFE